MVVLRARPMAVGPKARAVSLSLYLSRPTAACARQGGATPGTAWSCPKPDDANATHRVAARLDACIHLIRRSSTFDYVAYSFPP